MKKIFLLITFFINSAYALPIVNLNVSTNQNITVYPDHKDSNSFYVAPVALRLNQDEKGRPVFSYQEYSRRLKKKAIIQATMSAQFAKEEIENVKNEIRKSNPNATFKSIPFIESKVVFGDILDDLIEKSLCDHSGYQSESEQVCSFVFNNKGRKIFRKMLRQSLLITLNYHFTLSGVREMADGSFEEVTHTHSIAGRMGGRELLDYPELFRDSKGRIIKL